MIRNILCQLQHVSPFVCCSLPLFLSCLTYLILLPVSQSLYFPLSSCSITFFSRSPSLPPLRVLSFLLFSLLFTVIVLRLSEPSLKLPAGWVVGAHIHMHIHLYPCFISTYKCQTQKHTPSASDALKL